MSSVIFAGAVQLLGWSDTHNAGPKLVLQLESSDDLEAFKHLTVKHGKTAGQLLGIAVTLVNPETGLQHGAELPSPLAEKPKGGPLSRLAGMWVNNEEFCDWLRDYYPSNWQEFAPNIVGGTKADAAKAIVYSLCRVDSLALIDHDTEAAKRFNALIREPFMSRGGSSQ